ncbi:esterase-like activity of phytase family protein [Hyphomonas sp.]|uniref:esterase-like activity of phytase family protein n=1 Tax=Hyphomonas sp. TaxID=87 RepID=UPI0025C69D35|nr:esterase-like activity of phytase family protein [Hyphomonas sp.]
MKIVLPLIAAAVVLGFASCAAPGTEAEPVAARSAPAAVTNDLWTFAAAADGIHAASCPDGNAPMRGFLPLDVSVTELDAKQTESLAGLAPAGARLAGAWELTSGDPNFGGLSGLAVEDSNTLLAVTDAGGWVRIGTSGGAPAAATIGYMRGAEGQFLSGKSENDAEGLAVRDGIAFVSFERDFRIEAFAVGSCGAGAKAVEISALPATFEGRAIDTNEGPEALVLTPDGHLKAGFEGASTSGSPISRVLASGASDWTGQLADNPKGFALVGLDAVRLADGTTRNIQLYRAFDPLRGARSVLVWGAGANQRLTLSRPVLTDNFEGLAAEVMQTGELRLWIVSDNNFNKVQRTLLYAFDVTP